MYVDLKPLEFAAIQRLIGSLTATPYGSDAAANLSPAPSLAVARSMQAAVTAARDCIEAGRRPNLAGIPDVRAALRQAAGSGAALSTTAMHHVRVLMRAAVELAESLRGIDALFPDGEEALTPPQSLVEALDAALTPGGSLREDASSELKAQFEQRRRLRDEVTQTLSRVREKSGLAEDRASPHWHQERAVLTLRAGDAKAVRGVMRGTAMGGRDHLVEPIEAVPLNNNLDQVNGAINQEQKRLLRMLTDSVRAEHATLDRIVAGLTWIDLAFAAGDFSRQLNAHAPELVDEPVLRLDRAYHPLLLVQYASSREPVPQPIPLDLVLDDAQPVVLVTGPNTGGKTVALKTVGLITAMAHAGLHVPAEGSCTVGHFDRVLVDVGDHQSLYHHLSTFAGHVEVLKRVLDGASSHSLVLLDELGTGTDPDEGAALAMAMLDELRARGVRAIVNTHLAPLKDYASRETGIVNASMQFDLDRLAPTYRLSIGEPGVSFGLVIAEKNGLPSDLVGRARRYHADLCAVAGKT
ncbi:MAG: endonuclease MutS2 [Thioalkalivibrionaceae bacterium]